MARDLLSLATIVLRSTLLPAMLLLGCAAPEAPLGHDFDGESEPPKGDHSDACADVDRGNLSGDDGLVLVNKDEEQQLSSHWAPDDLVALPDHWVLTGRSALVRKSAAEALVSMLTAAQEETGQHLVVRSAYRSFSTQCWTFSEKVRIHGLEHARRYSAEPGRSQHQLGTTVDLTSGTVEYALLESFGDTLEGQWLADNAHRFGFALSYPKGFESVTGYAYEPWHFRFIGNDAAMEARQEGEILESYLRECNDADRAFECVSPEFAVPVANEGFVGGTCTDASDCHGFEGRAICVDGDESLDSSGQCSLECELYCPDRAGRNATTVCVDVGTDAHCHSRCDFTLFAETGCRDGYQCADGQRPNGTAVRACMPE